MSVKRIASVNADGVRLHVLRSGTGAVALTDGSAFSVTRDRPGGAVPVDEPRELGDLLLRAVDEDAPPRRAELVGTIGVVHVLRWPYCVTLTDHPDPRASSGWRLQREQARALGEALLQAAGPEPALG